MSTSMVRNGVSRDADEAAAIRAALAELGRALEAASVVIEELPASTPQAAAPPLRFAWRADTAGSRGTAQGRSVASVAPGRDRDELVVPIATAAGILGQLRIMPASPGCGWSERDEAAARAVAHALSGLLARWESAGAATITIHQLRAPLTAILAVSDIVRRYGERLSEEEKRHEMEKIQAQVRTLTRLLDDFAGAR